MQLTVKGKNIDVTDSLRSYAERKLSKISRYSDAIQSADITFSTERNWHIAEMTLHTGGSVLRGEEMTGDMYASIDCVVNKIEKQIRKKKEKHVRKPRAGGGLSQEFDLLRDMYEKAVNGQSKKGRQYGRNDEPNDEVCVVRRYSLRTMNRQEAVMEMESMGKDFFVFMNSSSRRVNVVYKGLKGYGLIDPII